MAKKSAMVFGIIFLLLGVLGFIPNPIVGDGAWFYADAMHNLVHLISGLVLLWVAMKSPTASATTLKVFGIIYLLVAVLGFLMGEGQLLGFIGINGADNWLHLVLGIVLLALGFSKKGSPSNVEINQSMNQPMV